MIVSSYSLCMRNVALRDTAFHTLAVALLQLPPCCSACIAQSASLPRSKHRAHQGGPLLFSARLDNILRPHHFRIKDWRYLQAALEVCDVLLSGVAI